MVIVLIIIVMMMVLTVTILSQSMSQSKTSRSQVDQIVGDELAKGLFWNSYASGACSTSSPTVTLNNRNYYATINSSGINCTVAITY